MIRCVTIQYCPAIFYPTWISLSFVGPLANFWWKFLSIQEKHTDRRLFPQIVWKFWFEDFAQFLKRSPTVSYSSVISGYLFMFIIYAPNMDHFVYLKEYFYCRRSWLIIDTSWRQSNSTNRRPSVVVNVLRLTGLLLIKCLHCVNRAKMNSYCIRSSKLFALYQKLHIQTYLSSTLLFSI